MLENSTSNGFKDSLESCELRFVVCPHCGHARNELHWDFCEACERSLDLIPPEKLESKVNSGNSLPKTATQSTNLPQKNLKKRIKKKLLTPILIGAVAIVATGIVAFKLNSNPYGQLKTAQGTISFGGEPCAQRLVNLKVASVLQKVNSNLKIRYLDNDRNKDQIQELIEGSVQIAFSEKAYLDSHFQRAKERGVGITAIPYAYDGIAFVTHKKTKVRPLSVRELTDIFEGEITNWKELGGADQIIKPILVSGKWANPNGLRLTRLNENTIFESDRALAKKILKRTPGAIFYTSATLAQGELEELNVLSVKNKNGTFVSPILREGQTNQQAIDLGKYPLVRTLYVIVNSEVFDSKNKALNHMNFSNEIVEDFVHYLVSEEGQAIVKGAGFVPKYLVGNR